MKVLIVSATRFEVEHLLNQMDNISLETGRLISSVYRDIEIDYLITGVGMTATAYYSGKVIDDTYDAAINVGICGSFNRNIEIGAIVNVYEDCFSELGAEDGDAFLTLNELGLEGVTKISNSKLQISNSVVELLPKVTGITVNTSHGNESSIEKVIEKFHPYVESMEGAAFMMVCESERIPYLQIRSVSNYVERRNKESWNIPLAIKNLNAEVIKILNEF
jgi:futalosine hydrolase